MSPPEANGDYSRYVATAHGVQMPRILYGTAWKKSLTQELVASAVAAGFRGFDTACQPRHYDEAAVGRALGVGTAEGLDRAELYVQTKFTPPSGQDPACTPYDRRARPAAQVAQSFATSLRNLETGYLDCLILHSPLPMPEPMDEVWDALETIFDAGGARELGISNCYDPAYLERLHDSARVKPAVVQNRFYAATRYDAEIRALCRERGILYQSFWTLTANPQLLEAAEVRAAAAALGRTPAQVLFRFVTEIGIVPLTGTTSAAHMRDDLEVFDFELGAERRRALAGLLEP